jgi:polyisoprenoid-binding protein YceI
MTTTATTKTIWNLDASHSELGFKVKHLMITNVSGSFGKFDVKVETDGDDFSTAKIHFTADTTSITTGSEQRDTHIKSPDFFDTVNYPEMKFESTSLLRKDDENYELFGDLTINMITNHVKLHVEYGGMETDPYGNLKAGFTINGKINRTLWDLNWNVPLAAGGLLVSEDVRIHAEVQFTKQA